MIHETILLFRKYRSPLKLFFRQLWHFRKSRVDGEEAPPAFFDGLREPLSQRLPEVMA